MVNMMTMQEAADKVTQAINGGDNKAIAQAWTDFGEVVSQNAADRVAQDYSDFMESKDESILASRGYRKLTSKEEAWYGKIADVMRSNHPEQAFVELIGSDNEDDVMPSTIIEDVFKYLVDEHPLLSRINTQSVKYLTKWVLNKHNAQTAAWGAITASVEKEITSDLKVVDLKQNKLSCFVILEKGMADLGPVFLDSYIRQVMADAMAAAMEAAVVSGDGNGQPIGMDRDLATLSNSGYSAKSAIAVTSFQPAAYGALLDNLTKTEEGHERNFSSVILICNQSDYLTKIMPATTVLTATGEYKANLFPFPTEVIPCAALESGKAILGIADEYQLFIGQAARNGAIEYSDEYKFLEDQRVFKVVQYADGRAYDNTSFVVLDISGLEPLYIPVETKGESETVEEA